MSNIEDLYSERRRLLAEIDDSVMFDDPVSVTERLAIKLGKIEIEIEKIEGES